MFWEYLCIRRKTIIAASVLFLHHINGLFATPQN